MFPSLFANDDLPRRPARRQPIKVAFDQFAHMREHAGWWDERVVVWCGFRSQHTRLMPVIWTWANRRSSARTINGCWHSLRRTGGRK